MSRAAAALVLLVALLLGSESPVQAQSRAWVVVRDPTGPPNVATSVLQSLRTDLEVLVRVRPGCVLGSIPSGSALPTVPPAPYQLLRAFVIDVRVITTPSPRGANLEVTVRDMARSTLVTAVSASVTSHGTTTPPVTFRAALQSAWTHVARVCP